MSSWDISYWGRGSWGEIIWAMTGFSISMSSSRSVTREKGFRDRSEAGVNSRYCPPRRRHRFS
jgi:hypothetical protein